MQWCTPRRGSNLESRTPPSGTLPVKAGMPLLLLLQLASFRQLHLCARDSADAEDASTQLVNNFRPPMPLNDRTVSASFRKFFA